jgi:RpiR family carbohydrate utilization transcriptional regulator
MGREAIGLDRAMARLRAALPTLPPSGQRVARAILAAPDATVHRSISEVAEVAQASTAAVVRCAQELGFRGFHDLKLTLAGELAGVAAVQADRADHDAPGDIVREVVESGV